MLQVLNRLWGSSLRNPSAYITWSGNALLDEYRQEQEQREAQERRDFEMAAILMQQVSLTACVHMALQVGILNTCNVPLSGPVSFPQPSCVRAAWAFMQQALLSCALSE